MTFSLMDADGGNLRQYCRHGEPRQGDRSAMAAAAQYAVPGLPIVAAGSTGSPPTNRTVVQPTLERRRESVASLHFRADLKVPVCPYPHTV